MLTTPGFHVKSGVFSAWGGFPKSGFQPPASIAFMLDKERVVRQYFLVLTLSVMNSKRPSIPLVLPPNFPFLPGVRRFVVRAFDLEPLPGERDENYLPLPRPAVWRPTDFGRPDC